MAGSQETIQRVANPTAILIGIGDDLAATCVEALSEGGLRVLRVSHVAAASERIPVVMPQLVVIPVSTRAEDVETLTDRCVAVGAEILRIGPQDDPTRLRKTLADAANVAFIRALRRSEVRNKF